MDKCDFLVTFASIIIDDILLWNGDIELGVLGGGGVHAIAGSRIWSDKVAISFPVGEDFHTIKQDLVDLGINLQGVKEKFKNTLRHWQIYYHDGTRIEIPRDPRISAHYKNTEPDFDKLPEFFSNAAGYHLASSKPAERIKKIRRINPESVIVYEPSRPEKNGDQKRFYETFLNDIDAFSPNLIEGQIITNKKNPIEMIKVLLDWGAKWVIIRMGEKGSISGNNSNEYLKIPAAPANVIDPTGAGNAFLGGLLCGITQKKQSAECLLMAAVSASFAIEQYGVAKCNVVERDKRYHFLSKRIDVI